ncbi:MAG: hypothetical protein ACRCUS_03820 [Anaerovoracaceae bacterium]
MGKRTRKAINFDLDDERLRANYVRPKNKPSHSLKDSKGRPRDNLYAYEELQKFFKKKGFQHRQYSGYISNEPISIARVNIVIKQMIEKFEWLDDTEVLKQCDVTEIGRVHSLNHIFNNPNISQKIK